MNEHRLCPLCGERDYELVLEYHHRFVVCSYCGARGPCGWDDGEEWNRWGARATSPDATEGAA